MFVKICGITREADALLSVAMGADAVGFNFVSGSKRQIAPSIARDIVRRLPPEILTVGIFRDEVPARVIDIMNSTGLKAAQLHGKESVETTRAVRQRVPIVIKAFADGDPALGYVEDFGADAVMLDGPDPGSGQVFDWTAAENRPGDTRVVLAGGLNAENVREAIQRVRPWGVDAASGVESDHGEPGEKDARKVMAFVEAAKRAGAELLDSGVEVEHGPYDWNESGWI